MKSRATASSRSFRTSSTRCWISSREKYRDFFEPIEQELIQNSELVTHRHLLEYIKRGDLEGYKHAIVEHFKLYTIYLERHKR